MIKQKKKTCVECGNEDYIFSKGRCKSCAQKSYKPLSSTYVLKSTTPIKKMTKKTQEAKKKQSEIRKEYFEYHIERCDRSEHSGRPIGEASRANICHLFDKGRHKSVQANLDNFIYLTFQEHSDFDTHLFKLEFQELEESFTKGWKIACERIEKLLPLVEEKTKFYFEIKKYIDAR